MCVTIAAMVSLTAGIFASQSAAAAGVMRAYPAQAFVDSVGVNLRAPYAGSSYENWPRVITVLKGLHIRHVRLGLTSSDTVKASYQQLAAAGIKLDFIGAGGTDCGPEAAAAVVANIDQYGSAVEAIEGPNEWDIFSSRPDWKECLATYQRNLYDAIRNSTTLRNVPILGPSFAQVGKVLEVPPMRGSMQFANLHPYAFGHAPELVLDYHLNTMFGHRTRRPAYVTEVGYQNSFVKPWINPPVPLAVAGAYIPRLFAEDFRRGITRTYLWQFLDTPAPANWPDQEAHFGLLYPNMTDKPAGLAMRRLMGILADPGRTFTAQPMPMAVTGGSDLHGLLLQKRSGEHYLLIWRAAELWNPDTQKRIVSPPKPATLTLRGGARLATLNPLGNGRWSALALRNGTARINVGARIIVVRIRR